MFDMLPLVGRTMLCSCTLMVFSPEERCYLTFAVHFGAHHANARRNSKRASKGEALQLSMLDLMLRQYNPYFRVCRVLGSVSC